MAIPENVPASVGSILGADAAARAGGSVEGSRQDGSDEDSTGGKASSPKDDGGRSRADDVRASPSFEMEGKVAGICGIGCNKGVPRSRGIYSVVKSGTRKEVQ
jgi:hypothetical protein